MSLANTLQQWILNFKDANNAKVRPFSHVASKPDEVEHWVPIIFDELQGPVAMDKRSVEFLNHKDITFHVGTRGNQSFIRCIDYKSVSASTEPQDEVKS